MRGGGGEDVFDQIDVPDSPNIHGPLVVMRRVAVVVQPSPHVHGAVGVVEQSILHICEEEGEDERR